MTTEKRLIDANDLVDKHTVLWDEALGFCACVLVEDIDNAPTVDAVELPCKIGDLVWGIRKTSGQAVLQGIVYQMFFVDDMRLCICVKGVCRGEWGRNVFATKEEALAKMGGDGNA